MLSPTLLRELFDGLHKALDLSPATDVTLEANPATFGLEKARLFREFGTTRVSLGIQSFTAETLATLGREHSPEEAAVAVRTLREAGLPSINVDLMFSIPGQTRAQWQHDLDTAVALEPDHISAYNLTYEEDTAFFDSLQAGEMDDDPDRNADHFAAAHDTLTAASYEHYETSNYARPGHQSQHNKGYWHGHDYLGLGPSAVSTIDCRRWKNVPDTKAYISQITAVGHAMTEIEDLTPEQLRIERIALTLRTTAGTPLALLSETPPARLTDIIEEGYATRSQTHFTLTDTGRPLVDEIAAHLI